MNRPTEPNRYLFLQRSERRRRVALERLKAMALALALLACYGLAGRWDADAAEASAGAVAALVADETP